VREKISNSAPIEVSDEQIAEALSPFGIIPSGDQPRKIRNYLLLLTQWNRAMSLTAITDPVEIVQRHFAESMFLSTLLPVENCRLADVGTGAGFPGLALKIACPKIQLILIESNKKKCAFLGEVVRALRFAGVEIRSERFEQIQPETVRANIITARAIGESKRLLKWSERALLSHGQLVLWIGAEDSTRITRTTGWNWRPAVHIPESQRRYILIGWPNESHSAGD
jgi:16S rRNA (guanine527-N7)-methyltransferase